MFKIKNETEVKIEERENVIHIDFENGQDVNTEVYVDAEKDDGLDVALIGGSTIVIKCNEIKIFNLLNNDSSRSAIAVYWCDRNDTCSSVSTYIPALKDSDIEIEITKNDTYEVFITVIV